MPALAELLLFTTLAGLCIAVGALIGLIPKLGPNWLDRELRHLIIAFGGGVLLGAVAVVLVPEGLKHAPNPWVPIVLFGLGGMVFLGLDKFQSQQGKSAPQLTAMLADFLPESLALGGMFALGADGAILLAVLIGLQNLPEGFNAWRELQPQVGKRLKIYIIMVLLALLGPICGLVGWYWLVDHKWLLSGIMMFAAGGILYLTFQDIAPQAKLEKHWFPPFGAVLGFAFALGGSLLLH